MRHRPFHDELVSTPEGLKQALEDPLLRQHYILDADIQTANLDMATDMPRRDKHGNPILNPVGGKRRIDLLLYRHGDGVVSFLRLQGPALIAEWSRERPMTAGCLSPLGPAR